jgi:hypothetical protein
MLKRKLLEEDNGDQQGQEKKHKVEIDKRTSRERVLDDKYGLLRMIVNFADIRDVAIWMGVSKTHNDYIRKLCIPLLRELALKGINARFRRVRLNQVQSILIHADDRERDRDRNPDRPGLHPCEKCGFKTDWLTRIVGGAGLALCMSCMRLDTDMNQLSTIQNVDVYRGFAMYAII